MTGARDDYKLGLRKLKQGNDKGPIAAFTHAIGLKPDFARAYEGRAEAYDGLNAYKTAIADYTRAIALDPTYADAYFNRGADESSLNQYQAEPDLSPAVSPSGSLVAYARGLHVYVIPAAGGAARSVGDGLQEVDEPTFSPNGRCVTYRWLVTYNGATNIVQYFTEQTNSVASGKIVKNDSDFLTGLYPAWSPDGSMMVASVIHNRRFAHNEQHFAIDAVDVATARAARFNGTPVSGGYWAAEHQLRRAR